VTHPIPRLRPVTEIDWFRNEEPETIAIWQEHVDSDEPDDAVYLQYGNYQRGFRARYMKNALLISGRFEGDVILLIPEVVTPDGEWETWYFGPAFGGAMEVPQLSGVHGRGSDLRRKGLTAPSDGRFAPAQQALLFNRP